MGVSEDKPSIVALWVAGAPQGLNGGEEAGAGVGAGVRCRPSALPGGREGWGGSAPQTCPGTGLAGQTPVPSCFLSGTITGMSMGEGGGGSGAEGPGIGSQPYSFRLGTPGKSLHFSDSVSLSTKWGYNSLL